MANTERRRNYIDKSGNMFMPMNVEGGVWNEHFITTPKFICIVGIILSIIVIIIYLNSRDIPASLFTYILWISIWAVASSFILRFIVFEEKFYYRMYQELQKHEISSPAIFWDIASIKDTDDGAIITYSDARVGIIVRIDRDTITGKTSDFKEIHYDALSDFYREVATNRYCFVQMNIMEQAGKDPRLTELSKLINKSDNPNICKLMELEIGHIKNITHNSLYESDYFLFYTNDLSKVDSIIDDVSKCIFKLLDGAYAGYEILGNKEIVDIVKELYGVNYFNATEASLLMFDNSGAGGLKPFNISGIKWSDGIIQDLNNSEISRIRVLTSCVIEGTKNVDDISLKDTFYKKNKEKFGVSFDDLDNIGTSNMYNNLGSVNINKANNSKIDEDDDDMYIDL